MNAACRIEQWDEISRDVQCGTPNDEAVRLWRESWEAAWRHEIATRNMGLFFGELMRLFSVLLK